MRKWIEPEVYKQKYYDYLGSESWERIKDRVLFRDDYICQNCGTSRLYITLHVHHKTYKRVFRERLSDLVTLCEDCHKVKHGK